MCWGYSGDDSRDYNGRWIGDNELPYTVGTINARTVFASTAGGCYHTCGMAVNGSVMCWGWGNFGQLGYGNTNSIGDDEYPYQVGYVNTGGATMIAVTAGNCHTCALAANGSVMCWGRATNGALGYGDNANIGDNETPALKGFVPIGAALVSISSAPQATHTCGLTANGSAICWGANEFGQLGYGHTNNIGDNEYPNSAGFVNAGIVFTLIQAGRSHTCGVEAAGNVRYGKRNVSQS
jgi:alpha-tubulin suppressor-like RCC1 family protein